LPVIVSVMIPLGGRGAHRRPWLRCPGFTRGHRPGVGGPAEAMPVTATAGRVLGRRFTYRFAAPTRIL